VRNKGVLAAAGAYIAWGLLPVYWKALAQVPPLEILGHRMIWSLAVALVLLAVRREWHWLTQVKNRPVLLVRFVVTALLLSVNWFTYIWATNNGHIVESSLGYFINPLINVLLGLLFLRERLRAGQWLAIGIALAGVSYLTLNVGGLLWISFSLALSFGAYGLLRKTAPLGSLQGLTLEMAVLFVPALWYLLSLQRAGTGAFAHGDPLTTILLVGAGIVTAGPLILFAYGAQRVTMTTLGILQYMAPTLQFLLGVFVYREAFSTARLAGFAVIWLALAVYTGEGYLNRKRRQAQPASG